jgi:hypothetical protein
MAAPANIPEGLTEGQAAVFRDQPGVELIARCADRPGWLIIKPYGDPKNRLYYLSPGGLWYRCH